MFQLIVAVISIALVAALAIASIFYGGDAFTKSSEKAVVTTLINQGQQIAGAAALYKTDHGVAVASTDEVVDGSHELVTEGYLAAAPAGAKVTTGNWYINADDARIEFDSAADVSSVCDEVARQGAGGCDSGYFYFDL
jgi:hypothetical protein